MKKYLVIAMALIMVLGFSSASYAVEGPPPLTETVPVSASVACYTSLVVTDPPDLLVFSGAPNETQSTTFTTLKETNCGVNYDIVITTQLTGPLGGTIATDLGITDLTMITYYNAPLSIHTDIITVRGTTGPSVTSQAAGSYSGVITLTVTEAP